MIAGHVEDQAAAAVGAAAGMMKAARNHHEALLDHLAAMPVDFEIQRTRQPEHQLRMLMAVDDQVVGVLAQGEDRSHLGSRCRVDASGRSLHRHHLRALSQD
ncbi:hypothetical protein D3C75_1207570 [compost metagenome]